MQNTTLSEQIQTLSQWKVHLTKSLDRYRSWLEANGLGSAEIDLRIFDLQDTLNLDKICIAFVAEFSRGKSELINAIFFSDYKRRLIPSEAGRTTMCPTEIFYDNKANQSYIRLLPIETRLEDTTIAEYKNAPENWTEIGLETNNAERMAETLREVIKTKHVPFADAEKMGLSVELPGNSKPPLPTDMVEIPLWRHAMISFPHPLLKSGLVVLDTPGLNALGNEPELTLNMLPNAQAILFVLGADTGVTKSDMDLWHNHIMNCRSGQSKGLLVVLNKIDTLWDELKTAEEINKSIMAQCSDTASQLKLDKKLVIPVSAQKGLLARIKGDDSLLQNSNLAELEKVLTCDIIPQKQAIIQDNVVSEVRSMILNNQNILQSRMDYNNKQVKELRALSNANAEALIHMMEKAKDERANFKSRLENFQARRKILAVQLKNMQEALGIKMVDKLINETRKNMSDSWTTMGLKSGMKQFFEGIKNIMDEANAQVMQCHKMLAVIYKQFAEQHGMKAVRPKLFLINKYTTEITRLYREGENYRQSKKTTLTEQSFVIKRFFISLVSRGRDIFYNAQRDSEMWGKTILDPLAALFKEQKLQLDGKLEKLNQISKSRQTVMSKVKELETGIAILQEQIDELNKLERGLSHPDVISADIEVEHIAIN